MARVTLTTQVITDTGITPAFTAGTDIGATYIMDADAYLEVINASGGSINVTVQTGGTLAGKAIADTVVAVGAGARAKIGHFDKRAYARPTGVSDAGKIYVDLSAVASVTAGAFR